MLITEPVKRSVMSDSQPIAFCLNCSLVELHCQKGTDLVYQ